jgi:hypothetical protein
MKDREVPNLQEIFSEGGFLIIYEVINYRLLVLGWRFAKTSVFMILGILVTFIASALEGIGVDLFAPLDRHGLYHIVMMIAIVLLFVATFGLKAKL